MWILLAAVLALLIVVGVIAYRRHRAADRRWKQNLAESDRAPVTTDPTERIFTKATPRSTPRPAPATLTGQRSSPPARRSPLRVARPAPDSSSSPSDYGGAVFTPIRDIFITPSPTPDDEPFKGHGGGFGGAGASGGWSSSHDPAPAAPSPEPAPTYSAPDPAPAPDPSPSPDFSSDTSFSND